MEKPLEGKNIFVTGGSRDIGAAIVDNLLNKGANVGFCYHHQSQTESIYEKYLARNINILPDRHFWTGNWVAPILADLKTAEGRSEIYKFIDQTFPDYNGLVLNAADSSLELNVEANLDLINEFESRYLFNPFPTHSVIFLQSVPGHFYDRLSKDWIPEFYEPIAKAKNKAEKEISKIKQYGGFNISIVCPPAVVDTFNWTQFKKRRDPEIDIKHKRITDALGLPTEVTTDEVGKKVAELLVNPPRFGSVEYFNGTLDAKVYLSDIYGPKLRLLDTFNVEQKSAWMIVTRAHCRDHFLGNPILPGFLIEEAAAQAVLLLQNIDWTEELPILDERSVEGLRQFGASVPGDILKFTLEDFQLLRKREFSAKLTVSNLNKENTTSVSIKAAIYPRRFLR